ncbi:MAG: VOC family protein [Mycobacteriales bacterium]
MPTRNEAWPDGTPCWVDCQVDDPAKAAEFYTALFGWKIDSAGEDAGGYLIGTLNDHSVAGIGPKPQQSAGMPSAWTTYFATSNADAAAQRVTEAGGQILMAPFDVFDSGRMAIGADAVGAVYGLWQAKAHLGFTIFNEAGTAAWNELHTKSYDAAQTFYSAVFGWTFNEVGGDQMQYSVFSTPGAEQSVGGIFNDPQLAADHPSYWLVWFAVGDCDEAVTKATGLGSSALMPPTDSPFGRMSVVRAPQGEVFGLIDMTTTVGEPPSGG